VVREGEHVVLVRQQRPGAAGPVIELPAGKIEPGESSLEAARRELAEECGLAAEDWRELGSFWAAPAYSTERVTVLAGNVSGTATAQADPDEEIDVLRVAAEDVAAVVEDAGSLAALALIERSP
jgi:ADP-ribose pyrophosphatase